MSLDTPPSSLRWAVGNAPPAPLARPRSTMLLRSTAPGAPVDRVEVALLARLRRGKMALALLPEVAARVTRLVGAGGGRLEAILELALLDPVLAARLVAAACAVDGAAGAPVRTVREALDRLGPIRTCELLFRVAYAAVAPPRSYGDELEASVRRSRRCAAAAQAIALRLGLQDAEGAHLLGLLHDLGEHRVWLALASLPDGLVGIDHARALVARHHEAAGEDLARAWRLPEAVVGACGDHRGGMAGKPLSSRLAAASSAVVDASTHGLTEERLVILQDIGASASVTRELVARFAVGRDRSA